MKKSAWAFAAGAVALAGSTAFGPTHLPTRTPDARRMQVVREYDVPVTKGQKNVAAIPAMMSFWGATNQQTILQSGFTYSLKPDRVAVVPANDRVPMRVYELTWDSPQADTVKVKQTLVVEIACGNVLFTTAKLPYPKEVRDFFARLLAKDDEINPDHPKLEAAAKDILAKAKYAADALEMAAVWVDENIQFKSRAAENSDTILANGAGNCVGMSKVACALLRKMGIPAECVDAQFVGGSGHEFIEAYLPDVGWVFYDPSNGTHGFKSLDVLMTAGWGFMTVREGKPEFHQGRFLECKDAAKYEEPRLVQTPLRPAPKGKTVAGVRVSYQAPSEAVRVRHLPLSLLMAEPTLEPGKAAYKKTPPPWRPQTQPASGPASAPGGKVASSRPA